MATGTGELRRGIYRTKNPEGVEDGAQVHILGGGGDEVLSESDYRAGGYAPAYDDLPWSDDYFAEQLAARDA